MLEKQDYPGVIDRVKAVVVDYMILLFFIIIVTYTFSIFDEVPDTARIIAFVFIFILYDPLFTSIFGGTIGHMSFGIRVKRDQNRRKNILFPLALIRFIIKALLGWISLITVMGNKNRKAIHDYLVGSVVVFKDSEEIASPPQSTSVSDHEMQP